MAHQKSDMTEALGSMAVTALGSQAWADSLNYRKEKRQVKNLPLWDRVDLLPAVRLGRSLPAH